MVITFFAMVWAFITPAIVLTNVPAPVIAHDNSDESEWSEFHADAYEEYADEFTALFNSYEVKRAKNGATMIRQGNSGSFKFAKKG